jgi:hypothetical protein
VEACGRHTGTQPDEELTNAHSSTS